MGRFGVGHEEGDEEDFHRFILGFQPKADCSTHKLY